MDEKRLRKDYDGFLAVMKMTGYPDVEYFTFEQFRKVAKTDGALDFLRQFSTSVTEENLVDPDLRNHDDNLLDKDDLDLVQQFQSIGISGLDADLDEMETKVLEKEHEVTRFHSNHEELLRLCEQLRNQTMASQKDLSQAAALKLKTERVFQQMVGSCSESGSILDEELKKLCSVLDDIYQQLCSVKSENTNLYSRLDLSDYLNLEDRYAEEVTAFTRKQFFEGIADLAQPDASFRHELLNLSDPDSLLVRGEGSAVREEQALELKRLRGIYPLSEKQLIDSSVTLEASQALQKFLSEKKFVLENTLMPDTESKLTANIREAEQRLFQLKENVTRLEERTIPLLLHEIQKVFHTPILQGDYRLRLIRQNYLIQRQDKLIRMLAEQAAKAELLSAGLDWEHEKQRRLNSDIATVQNVLTLVAEQHQKNLAHLEMLSTAFDPLSKDRKTIDTRDYLTNAVYDALKADDVMLEEDSAHKPLFRTYEHLKMAAENLAEKINQQEVRSDINNSYDTKLAVESLTDPKIIQSIDRLIDLTKGDSPQSEQLRELESSVVELQNKLSTNLNDYNEKKKELELEPNLAEERKLFVNFFCDPPALREQLNTT